MTVVTRQLRENRLAKLTAPGGMTEVEAAAAATANLEAIRDECVAQLDRDFELLKRAAADPHARNVPLLQREIYAHANAIAAIGGACGLGEMGEAAFSLCELVDRQIIRGAWSDRAVAVHLDAMGLLRRADNDLAPAARKALIAGLRHVAVNAPLAAGNRLSVNRGD